MQEVASSERNQVTPAADGSSSDTAGPPGPDGRRGWPSPVALIITGFTVIGLGLRLFLLSLARIPARRHAV